jgi:hypothetical protein
MIIRVKKIGSLKLDEPPKIVVLVVVCKNGWQLVFGNWYSDH